MDISKAPKNKLVAGPSLALPPQTYSFSTNWFSDSTSHTIGPIDSAPGMDRFILISPVISIPLIKYFEYHLCAYLTDKRFESERKLLSKQTYKCLLKISIYFSVEHMNLNMFT